MNPCSGGEPTGCTFGHASGMRVGVVLCHFELRYHAYSLNTP